MLIYASNPVNGSVATTDHDLVTSLGKSDNIPRATFVFHKQEKNGTSRR